MLPTTKPITKKEAIEMYVNCWGGIDDNKKDYIINTINNETSDIGFLKDFNRLMTIKIRMFAPGLYQIVYN